MLIGHISFISDFLNRRIFYARIRSNGTLDAAGTQATRAYIDTLDLTLDQGADALNVRLPLTLRLYMGVAHIVAAHHPFAADLAYTCHCYTSSTWASLKPHANTVSLYYDFVR